MPGYNLVTLLSTTSSVIQKNNATGGTYFIGLNMAKKPGRFLQGARGIHESVPIPLTNYPVVFFELVGKTEEVPYQPDAGKRDMNIKVDIVCITNIGPGKDELKGRQKADEECIYLTQNIEYLIRNEIYLSNTVEMCTIDSTDYSSMSSPEKTYNAVGTISLNILKTNQG